MTKEFTLQEAAEEIGAAYWQVYYRVIIKDEVPPRYRRAGAYWITKEDVEELRKLIKK